MRTHISLPDDLVAEVDEIAGPKGRSKFIEELVRERLKRERLRKAIDLVAGYLDPKDYPEWATPAAVSAWVRKSRDLDNQRLEEKLARWNRAEE